MVNGVLYFNEAVALQIRSLVSPDTYLNKPADIDEIGIKYFDDERTALWPLTWRQAAGFNDGDYRRSGATSNTLMLKFQQWLPFNYSQFETIKVIIERQYVAEQGLVLVIKDRFGDLEAIIDQEIKYTREIYPLGDIHEVELERLVPPLHSIVLVRDKPVTRTYHYRVKKIVYVAQSPFNQQEDQIRKNTLLFAQLTMEEILAKFHSHKFADRLAVLGVAVEKMGKLLQEKQSSSHQQAARYYEAIKQMQSDQSKDDRIRSTAKSMTKLYRSFFEQPAEGGMH
ncbi:hypothetical protein [Methylomarinum vadi]|uniref:hypothetical protein n=1 Tax=Methylomarinum vadi TaxID=438855 RepID=UPI0004DF897B|nr:hypothetical protein [Methylomarinum vadi]